MKRRRSKAASKERPFRVWTRTEARGALPYITSVVRSLREHYLDARAEQRRAERLNARPGRPNRDGLLALDSAARAFERSEEQATDAARELKRLNVYCLDVAGGLALVPFAHPKGRLAWYVFDLYAPDPLTTWRFHDDPLETRRPIDDSVTGQQTAVA